MSTKRSSRRLVTSISDAPFSLTGFVSVTSTVIRTLSPPSSTITHLRLFPIGQTRNRFHLSHIRLQLQSTLILDNYYKPDLKNTALARCSVISKGLRVAKSHLKKRNMQA
ncbi:Uncharacterized protein Rs2_47234 [Raphanus sativus]|nr:Uncharacterized protein Rs2_47234 [Raphanus sativus]